MDKELSPPSSINNNCRYGHRPHDDDEGDQLALSFSALKIVNQRGTSSKQTTICNHYNKIDPQVKCDSCLLFQDKNKLKVLPTDTFAIMIRCLDFRSLIKLASCNKAMGEIIYKKSIWLWRTINFSKLLSEPLSLLDQGSNENSDDNNNTKDPRREQAVISKAREEEEKTRILHKRLGRMSDNDLATFLTKVNAKQVTKVLILRNCSGIQGYGLHPIRKSTTLHHLDLRTRCDVLDRLTGLKLDSEDVLETLRSLTNQTLPKVASGEKNFSLSLVLMNGHSISKDLMKFLQDFRDFIPSEAKTLFAHQRCSTCYHPISDKLSSEALVQRQLCWTCGDYSCQRMKPTHCSDILECNVCKERHCTSCGSFVNCKMKEIEDKCSKAVCAACARRQTCSCCLQLSCGCVYVAYCNGCRMTYCEECNEDVLHCDVCGESFCDSCRVVTFCDACHEASCDMCDDAGYCERCSLWFCSDCAAIEFCQGCLTPLCGECAYVCTDCHYCDDCVDIAFCCVCNEFFCFECDEGYDVGIVSTPSSQHSYRGLACESCKELILAIFAKD